MRIFSARKLTYILVPLTDSGKCDAVAGRLLMALGVL